MAREPYDSTISVGRQKFVNDIVNWADEAAPLEHWKTIVGPPGIGKSWVAAAIREQLQADPKRKPFVYWADLSLQPSGMRPDDLTDDAQLSKWIESMIVDAQQVCGGKIKNFDRTLHPATVLQSFVRDLCEYCQPASPPILIVDGLDEVGDENQRRRLEMNVLVSFLGKDCTRLLLTRRDENELELSSALRWNEGTLPLDSLQPPDDIKQLQTRATARYPAMFPFLTSLVALIPPYKWQHPHVNASLLDRAATNQANGKNPLLNATDLRDVLDDIVKPAVLGRATFERLDQLAHLKRNPGLGLLDEWSAEDIRPLGFDLNDVELYRLFELGIVVEAPPRHKIADGIRELVRAWRAM
jgi:hypothetical protein